MAAPPSSSPAPRSSRPGDDWFFAGLASSFPNITNSSEPHFKLVWPQPCKAAGVSADTTKVPGCKIFHPKAATTAQPSPTPAAASSVEEIDADAAAGEDAWLMKEQVLVFRYKGAFHAVDHACPHRSYSLSWGVPFDIEDAGGRTLGHAIRCRGHSFAFELTTGAGDRGAYQLGVWDVELRPAAGVVAVGAGADDDEEEEREVWVRRRKRKQGPD
ncbi:hypothetical protein INS49_015575 [Diaporthe citri]|uniref:uncharacterized protein n=1 Tax=Diaporthe citri TaxID=83186 RepID=UPI001C7E4FA4|nr:uncharacterized protein INS49_015575 [Diaporthe citri]KAG6356188.1 hypothetical protein INS49_015575 [Diaporthe citri]